MCITERELPVAFALRISTSFVLISDSTTANDTGPNSGGWGNRFCASLAEALLPTGLFNASLSFIAEEVSKGRCTLVTVQFGRNDMKIAPSESMGQNMSMMTDQIRAADSEPVLVTSLTRRTFDANEQSMTFLAYETRLIAKEKRTHLLSLNAASIAYVETVGPDAAHRLNHLNMNGTIVGSHSNAPHTLPIILNPSLTYNITHGIPSF
ncbi:carbohydrate esterase family 12 protein [Ramaria rubella]|nr:carbohydrate esterase family 12 protein [Ramaria rubella]